MWQVAWVDLLPLTALLKPSPALALSPLSVYNTKARQNPTACAHQQLPDLPFHPRHTPTGDRGQRQAKASSISQLDLPPSPASSARLLPHARPRPHRTHPPSPPSHSRASGLLFVVPIAVLALSTPTLDTPTPHPPPQPRKSHGQVRRGALGVH